jgi:hypothetical protein
MGGGTNTLAYFDEKSFIKSTPVGNIVFSLLSFSMMSLNSWGQFYKDIYSCNLHRCVILLPGNP